MHEENYLKWFDRHGVQRPTHLPHGVSDTPEKPLSEQLERIKVTKWWMEGNVLHAKGDLGDLVQTLPTDVICHGTDENGNPILTRIKQ